MWLSLGIFYLVSFCTPTIQNKLLNLHSCNTLILLYAAELYYDPTMTKEFSTQEKGKANNHNNKAKNSNNKKVYYWCVSIGKEYSDKITALNRKYLRVNGLIHH